MSDKKEYIISGDDNSNEASRNLLISQNDLISSEMILEKIKNQRNDEINRLLNETPLCEDTTCGYWIFKGPCLQSFAKKKYYVLLYGLVGAFFGMTNAYFSGTITTIEKRFKIPSKNTGIISVACDISQLLITVGLSYYTGKGHRPRWMGVGMLTIVAYCLLTILPHLLYGPGIDAIELTKEFINSTHQNTSLETIDNKSSSIFCSEDGAACQEADVNFTPQLILFAGQFISGIGGSLYFTLGATYLDDNSPRAETPVLLSVSYFMRMLGPAIGFALASFCLKYYIAPHLHPIITSKDPRWMGAWWLGWIIISILITIFGFLLSLYPKELPEAKIRRIVDQKLNKTKTIPVVTKCASFKDMKETFSRLIRNPIFMLNNLASVCYLFGYMPHLVYITKYMEIQFRQTASKASMVTGAGGLVFAACGVLIAGILITKYKPKARYLAGWNVIVEFLTVLGMLSYAFIGCPGNESSSIVINSLANNSSISCSSNCHCDYVPYAPVCGEDGNTYVSACHAGCKNELIENGKKIYVDCSCVSPISNSTFPIESNEFFNATTLNNYGFEYGGIVRPGACLVNCNKQFLIFVIVMCALKFFGATGRTTNFLISIRSVSDHDKPTSLGIDAMMLSMFAFIPSPVFFGWLMDQVCLVSGKTCSRKGNCWLYDTALLRIVFNLVPAAFISLCTIIDIFVWYYVKDLKVFDEEIKEVKLRNDKKPFHDINKELNG